MKAKKKTRPRTRTQATYTATVRKIAHHILLLASQRPQGELLELTQSQIADALEVSERSVIRAMPLLRSGVEHAGRGFWRIVSAPALQAIALDPQITPAHNDDTPARPLEPASTTTPKRSKNANPPPPQDSDGLAEKVAELTARFDSLSLRTDRSEERIVRLEKRNRVRPTPSAAARLTKWINALGLPDRKIAAKLKISVRDLHDYADGTCTPIPNVRERIRERTGISPHAWDTPEHPHIQPTLNFGFQWLNASPTVARSATQRRKRRI